MELGEYVAGEGLILSTCENASIFTLSKSASLPRIFSVINEKILGKDADFDSVKIEAFSQVLSINPSPATYSPNSIYQVTAPGADAQINFTWATKCEHVKEQPY